MKKKCVLFLSIIIVLGISSCNFDTKKITVIGENSSTIQSMQTLKSDYESKNKIELDFKPNTFEDAFTKSNQDFANKTGLYDIVLQYNFSLSSFVANDYVYSLDELKAKSINKTSDFESDIFDNVWKEVGYYYEDPKNPDNNKVKAIAYPFAANTMLLVYNKELFNDPAQQAAYKAKYKEDLKVPTDLVTYKKVAEFFTQPDKGLSGVCLQGSTGGWLYYEWCSFLQGFNGKVMDKNQGWKGDRNTKVLLGDQASINATNYYLSLKPYNAGNFSNVDGVEQRNIIKKGKVAMGLIWSDYVWGLIDNGNGKLDSRFGFAPTPGTKSMIAGGSFYVNRQSKNADESFKYIQYLLQKDNQIKMLKQGLCSPIKSVYDAPEVQDVPFVPALKSSINRAEYMLEAGIDADVINNIITKYIQKIWNNELSSADGLKAAKQEIESERAKLFK